MDIKQELSNLLAILKSHYLPALYKSRSTLTETFGVMEERFSEELVLQFSEKFLQVIWNERHLMLDLHVESGKELKILSPGIWNVGSGPDFHGASLLIGGQLIQGDVEIHKRSSDWLKHHHDTDPAYQNVVLHGVWQNDMPPIRPEMETFVISGNLQSDWRHLLWQLEDACYPYSQQVSNGECALRWAMSSDEKVQEMLGAAGLARFATKGAVLARLAVDCGYDQALYEMLFECLGYKNNRSPFRMLARQISLSQLQSLSSEREREAMLFGCAGFIPDPTMETVLPFWQEEVLELWDKKWLLGIVADEGLVWSKSGQRPYNTPCRRLAGGIEMLRRMEYRPYQWLRAQVEQADTPKEFIRRIERLNDKASIWRDKLDFGHTIQPPADLLGRPRLLDMVSNVMLPFLAGVCELEEGEKSPIVEKARLFYLSLPIGQENRLLKEAVQRFLIPPSRVVDLVKTTCQQQGMLDIYTNFCQALNNNCELCPFGGKSPQI